MFSLFLHQSWPNTPPWSAVHRVFLFQTHTQRATIQPPAKFFVPTNVFTRLGYNVNTEREKRDSSSNLDPLLNMVPRQMSMPSWVVFKFPCDLYVLFEGPHASPKFPTLRHPKALTPLVPIKRGHVFKLVRNVQEQWYDFRGFLGRPFGQNIIECTPQSKTKTHFLPSKPGRHQVSHVKQGGYTFCSMGGLFFDQARSPESQPQCCSR